MYEFLCILYARRSLELIVDLNFGEEEEVDPGAAEYVDLAQ